MIDHCCDANKQFNAREARSKVRSFRKKGARKATLRLIQLMRKGVSEGDSLLDIGGGVGVIGLELKGVEWYTSVDASRSYQAEAKKLYADRAWPKEQLHFITADFVEVAEHIATHDHVTLDKVICCYPEMKSLLIAACGKADKQLGLVYPQVSWLAKAGRWLANVYLRMTGSAFRAYIHAPAQVSAVMHESGYTLEEKQACFPWWIEVWKKS